MLSGFLNLVPDFMKISISQGINQTFLSSLLTVYFSLFPFCSLLLVSFFSLSGFSNQDCHLMKAIFLLHTLQIDSCFWLNKIRLYYLILQCYQEFGTLVYHQIIHLHFNFLRLWLKSINVLVILYGMVKPCVQDRIYFE